jgi:hypothetical protein
MSQSDFEARLRRAEAAAQALAIDLRRSVAPQIAAAQAVLFSGGIGWGATNTGGSSGVVTDGVCGVDIPDTLYGRVFVGFDSTTVSEFNLDWDGTQWAGCLTVRYPGPLQWTLQGGIYVQSFKSDFAVDATPLWVTLRPVYRNNDPTDVVIDYRGELGQLIDTDVTTSVNYPYYVNGLFAGYTSTDIYCPVSGDCSDTPNLTIPTVPQWTCAPAWSATFGYTTPPGEDFPPLPGKGMQAGVTISIDAP